MIQSKLEIEKKMQSITIILNYFKGFGIKVIRKEII